MEVVIDPKREHWFDYLIVYMKIIAMHPLDFAFVPQNLKFVRHFLNFLFYVFWHFTIIHLAYVQDVSVYLYRDQTLDDIISYVMNGSIYSFGYFIIIYMEYNLTKILKLFKFMQVNFRERSARGFTYVSLDESIETGKKYCNFWLISCLAGTLSWLIYPMFKCCNILPIKSWYPVDVSSFPNYQIAYFFQIWGQVFVGIGYGIVGGVNITMVTMLCGQFDILFASLKNLNTAVSKSDSKKVQEFIEKQKNYKFEEQEVNQYITSTEKFDEPIEDDEVPSVADCLKECVEHHRMLLDFVVLLEDLFTWFVLPKILYAALLVCLIAFVFSTQDEFQLVKVANLLMYLMLSSSELLLFNLTAEMLKQHSARAGDALMRSNWDDSDYETRKSMLIILANAMKPAQLTAGKFLEIFHHFYEIISFSFTGKFLNLSIDQFQAAMGTAFSYYTLLSKLREKSKDV